MALGLVNVYADCGKALCKSLDFRFRRAEKRPLLVETRDLRALRDQRQHAVERRRGAPSMRRSTSTRNLTPKRSAIALVSSMIAFDSARVTGSEQISSSVAPVSALIGLKQAAPQFQPDLIADAVEHRRGHAGFGEQSRQPLDVGGDFARGLADRKMVAIDVADHTRLDDFGRGINDAADRALRSQLPPLAAAGIDAPAAQRSVAIRQLTSI
jgi:hypothetical protein